MSVTSIENLPVSHRFNSGVCGFENLRHLIADSIRIGRENGLKNLEILELVCCINNVAPAHLMNSNPTIPNILRLPKLKELHIKKMSSCIIKPEGILEAVRLAKEKKN